MNNKSSLDVANTGLRLRNAREIAGLTQADVAKRLGVSRTTLVSIEKGTRHVSTEELHQLANIYKISLNGLMRQSVSVGSIAAKFRSGSRASETSEAEAIKKVVSLAQEYRNVEILVGDVEEFFFPREKRIFREQLAQQAADLALQTRHLLKVGPDAPLYNLKSLAEIELSVRIFIRPVDSSIAGVFFYDEAVGACILINAKHPPARRRWTLAHELGHFFTSRSSISVDHVDNVGSAIEEQLADRFASELLMPAPAVREQVIRVLGDRDQITPRMIAYLAHHFGVSGEAMTRRLEALDLLSKGTWKVLKKKKALSRIDILDGGFAREENDDVQSPNRFVLLTLEGVDSGALSEGQAARMLGTDRLQVREWAMILASDVEVI